MLCDSCNRSLSVSASQAGAAVNCDCGAVVQVPRMSQLRKSAGETAIPLSTAEAVGKMVANGELPQNEVCPLSLRPANETLHVHAICEQPWTTGGGDSTQTAIALGCLFGWFGYVMARESERPEERHGRDTVVDLPIRISSDVRDRYHRQNQAQLKSLLSQTPMYAKLLKEYPKSKIQLPRN